MQTKKQPMFRTAWCAVRSARAAGRHRRNGPKRAIATLAIAACASCSSGAAAQPAWIVQPETSSLEFGIAVLGEETKGAFVRWRARIRFDPDAPGSGRVEVDVDMSSLRLSDPRARETASGGEWLDVAGRPMASFKAEGFEWNGERLAVAGTLDLRGVSRPLTLEGRLIVTGDVAFAELSGSIARAEHGIGDSSMPVGAEATVRATVNAVRAP